MFLVRDLRYNRVVSIVLLYVCVSVFLVCEVLYDSSTTVIIVPLRLVLYRSYGAAGQLRAEFVEKIMLS